MCAAGFLLNSSIFGRCWGLSRPTNSGKWRFIGGPSWKCTDWYFTLSGRGMPPRKMDVFEWQTKPSCMLQKSVLDYQISRKVDFFCVQFQSSHQVFPLKWVFSGPMIVESTKKQECNLRWSGIFPFFNLAFSIHQDFPDSESILSHPFPKFPWQ